MHFKILISVLLVEFTVTSLHAFTFSRDNEDTQSSSSDSDESESSESFEFLEPEGPEENPKCISAEDWPRLYPTCSGLKQSPINIQVSNVQLGYKPVSPLCWENYDKIPLDLTLINEGHTLQLSGRWRNGEVPTISCGVLGTAKYQFQQWHCHWAKNNHNGSDHTFNGKPYPVECHTVHFRQDYGNFSTASLQPDGVAVISHLFEISNAEDILPLDIIGPAIPRLATMDNATVLPLPLAVFAPTFNDNYVSYHGSLTTPPCSESVIWVISIKSRPITKQMIHKFRRVSKGSECNDNNFRNTQEINGRDIVLVPDKNVLKN